MKKHLLSYGMITLGSLLFALSFQWLYAPNKVAMGGVTGLAQVIHHLFPALPVGVLILVMNIPIFLAGWKFIGLHLLASSLFSLAVSSVAIDLIASFHAFAPMDPMLSAICGGALTGTAFGMVFSQGATTGGTDIISRLLKLKFPWLPLAKLMLLPDGLVLLSAALAFGNVASALFGVVALFVSTRVMDSVLYGMNTSKMAYIISEQWEAIAQRLMGEVARGVTILDGKGGYTQRPKQVLLVAFRQRDIVEIRHAVRDIDPHAFMIVCDAHEVLGEGFGDHQKEEL